MPMTPGPSADDQPIILKAGDTVQVELYRGGRDVDGIHRGGAWTTKRGVVLEQINPGSPPAYARILVQFGDGDHQVMSPIAGEEGFPYRRAQRLSDEQ